MADSARRSRLRRRLRRPLLVDARADHPLVASSRVRRRGRGDARRAPGPRAADAHPRRARPCSSASSPAWAWRGSCADFAACSDARPAPLGVVARGHRDLRRRPGRRPQGPGERVGAGQARRHGARRHRPVVRRRHHALLPRPVRRHLRRSRPTCRRFMTVLWVVGMANAVNLHRRPRRAGRRHRRHRRGRVLPLRPPARPTSASLGADNIGPLVAVIVLGICLGFLPVQLPPGPDLHGRLRRAPARPADGRVDDRRSAARPTPSSPARRSSSSPRCSSRSSSSACRSSTPPSPSCAGPRGGPAWPTADKDHLHHRLMRLGHGQRRSVLILWAWTALLSALVLYPTYTDQGNAVVPFAVVALGARPVHRVPPGRRGRRRRPTRRTSRPPAAMH